MSSFDEYRKISNEDLVRRNDLGEKCFEDIQTEVNDLKRLIDEMIEIAENRDLPKGLTGNLNSIVKEFKGFATRIIEYKFDGDNNFQNRNRIVSDIRNYYKGVFANNQKNQNNFLTTYNSIKNFGYDDLNKLKNDVSTFKTEAKKVLKDVSGASDTLKKEASKITVSDYANIFEEESSKYSSFRIKPNIKIGSSERYFIAGVLGLFVFLILILNLNFWIPEDQSSWEAIIPFYLRKFVILSILIFIIRFAFKQFMINKHLATINKHRQNTLNSFRLFIESISSDDPATKDLLLIEVSRAIYEQGNTGFLSDSGKKDSNNPSILEMTKLVTKSGNEA